MANNIAFQPMGKTIRILTNANTANNLTMTADSPCQQYRLVNHASQPAYVWISPSASPINAASPTSNGAGAAYSIVVPPGTFTVITGPQCSSGLAVQASAIAETGTPDVYITPGEGL